MRALGLGCPVKCPQRPLGAFRSDAPQVIERGGVINDPHRGQRWLALPLIWSEVTADRIAFDNRPGAGDRGTSAEAGVRARLKVSLCKLLCVFSLPSFSGTI